MVQKTLKKNEDQSNRECHVLSWHLVEKWTAEQTVTGWAHKTWVGVRRPACPDSEKTRMLLSSGNRTSIFQMKFSLPAPGKKAEVLCSKPHHHRLYLLILGSLLISLFWYQHAYAKTTRGFGFVCTPGWVSISLSTVGSKDSQLVTGPHVAQSCGSLKKLFFFF